MDNEWVEKCWEKMCAKMEAQCDRIGTEVPDTLVNGKHNDLMKEYPCAWATGFWPGMLWLMYKETKKEKYRSTAEKIEDMLDEVLDIHYEKLIHDIGFQWSLTAVQNYKVTGNKRSRTRALHAANLLAGRYNLRGKFIRAWNWDKTGWLLIQSLMNLPLLYWASIEIDDPRYDFIAIAHADTTLKYLLRPDGSCHQIGIIDSYNGKLLETPRGQGYAPGSSWSRGQSWGMYGFAMNYIHTGYHKYFEASLRIAHYVLDCLEKNDFVPLVDYKQPAEPQKIDTSAGMIAASGLITLASIGNNPEKDFCLNGAMKILQKLEAEFVDWKANTDFIVHKAAKSYHSPEEEPHRPLIYGDYYFLEALTKLRNPVKTEVTFIEQVQRNYVAVQSGDIDNKYMIKKEELITWIEKHFNKESLSLRMAADYFGFSEPYFSKIFKTIMGQNFSNYLENIRMHHAQALLKQHLKIEEVSHRCGYETSKTFRRAYKRYFGIIPSRTYVIGSN